MTPDSLSLEFLTLAKVQADPDTRVLPVNNYSVILSHAEPVADLGSTPPPHHDH